MPFAEAKAVLCVWHFFMPARNVTKAIVGTEQIATSVRFLNCSLSLFTSQMLCHSVPD